MLSVTDVAAHLGATEPTIRRWIRQGDLRAVTLGDHITDADDGAFLRRRSLRISISSRLLVAGARNA